MLDIPIDFIHQIKNVFPDEYEEFLKALENPVKRSFRLHPSKVNLPITLPATSWHNYGFQLPDNASVTWDPLFHAGVYYVQESSSMFLKSILETLKLNFTQPTIHLLDLCAAPGGKSTILAETFLNDTAHVLVANEVIKSRVNILNENLLKWGFNNCIVTNNDPSDFSNINETFDLILVDAPCSGEGMFRKDPDAMKEWSLDNVKLCSARQERILHDIWPSLKPGGFLVYATCTYNPMENLEQIKKLVNELEAQPCQQSYNIPSEIRQSTYQGVQMFQFLPHKVDGEGLFISVVRKKIDHESKEVFYSSKKNTSNKKSAMGHQSIDGHNKFLIEFKNKASSIQHQLILYGNTWYAQHHSVVELINKIKNLKIIRAGLPLGEIKGKDFIPEHALALQLNSDWNIFPTRELTYEEAIQFLSKENIEAKNNQGWTLVTYQKVGLGYIKELGNRTNNYYPNEWRIRTQKNEQVSDFQLLNYFDANNG
jgi:16S rRNA C967 or C1407 C5-methylase (RsmB/RsmF family)/NOL1/NOP2/fmu family ribosome biogenesis protein